MPKEEVICVCGRELEVESGSCSHCNCPNCGMLLKVGSCDA